MRNNFLYAYKAKRFWGLTFILVACVVLLAACGSSAPTTTNTGSSGGTTPTATSASSGGGAYGSGDTGTTPTPTTAASTGSSALVTTTTATVAGKSETILTNAQGMTLYYRTSDAPPNSVCSGGCATAWPPLLSSGSSTPTGSSGVTGKLTVITDTNGSQVEYNGHLLYTYAADTAPGQTTGQAVGGVWYVATPGLAQA